MANKLFSDLVARVNPSVPGCPHATIKNYIRDAAIHVCEQTLVWRYQIPLYNLLPAVHEYTFDVPTDTAVHAVFGAVVNNSPLQLMNLDDALRAFPQWADLYSGESLSTLWSETPSGSFNSDQYNAGAFNDIPEFVMPDAVVEGAAAPLALTQLTPDKYIVLPLPDDSITYQMRMFVALKPKRTATGMDENVLNEIEDVVVHRALQNLLLIPNVPWSDKELATYHAKQFKVHATERRARANLGNNRASLSVAPRDW